MAANQSQSQHHNQMKKKVPLFPLLSLLCFVFIFFLLSLIRKTSVPSQSPRHQQQSFQFHDIDGSDPGTHPSMPCEYSDGSWVYDSNARISGYDNTCKEIFKGWNCISSSKSNSRDLIKWRWKPTLCDLPPFDPASFLQKHSDTSIVTPSFSYTH